MIQGVLIAKKLLHTNLQQFFERYLYIRPRDFGCMKVLSGTCSGIEQGDFIPFSLSAQKQKSRRMNTGRNTMLVVESGNCIPVFYAVRWGRKYDQKKLSGNFFTYGIT